MTSFLHEINQFQNANKEVMGTFSDDTTIVRRIIEKVAKIDFTPLIASVPCKGRANTKCCRREILQLEHFGEDQCWNWTGSLEQSSMDVFEIKDGLSLVSLDLLSTVCIDIDRYFHSSESSVPVRLADVQ